MTTATLHHGVGDADASGRRIDAGEGHPGAWVGKRAIAVASSERWAGGKSRDGVVLPRIKARRNAGWWGHCK